MDSEYIDDWKNKKLIQRLSNLKGAFGATSVITLILPEGEQIPKISSMLTTEYSTASNIKSRVNRNSVLDAITTATCRLKLYRNVPKNGLVILAGNIIDDSGREKKLSLAFTPNKPIKKFVYYCDSQFHLEQLIEAYSENNKKIGYLIIDGNGTYFYTVSGSNIELLEEYSVSLPKKHAKGGQSSVRFARLAEEARHNYITKVSEKLIKHFIKNDMPIFEQLYIAGSAGMKDRLVNENFIDHRLKNVLCLPTINIAYSGNMGLREALLQTNDKISRNKLANEETILNKFFEEINLDTNKFCYLLTDTMIALELGIIDTLIICEKCNLKLEKIPKYIEETDDYQELITISKPELIDIIIIACKLKNIILKIVSDSTSIGSQFLLGFGGLGGILRYQYNFNKDNDDIEENSEDFI
jgi:peptide chain release factor subunit 1